MMATGDESKAARAAFVKRCAKCERWHTEESWRHLSFVGFQEGDDLTLELRNCDCGSTLARVVRGEVLS